jgi:ABC-2 type transport system permease protein
MILDKARAVLKKDILTALRYRNGFVRSVISPAVQLGTFYYLSRAVGPEFRPEGMPYFLFLLIGTGFYTFLLTGMYGFLETVQEAQQSGTLEVLMTSSTSPAVLLCLSAASVFANEFVQFLIYLSGGILILGSPLHAQLSSATLVFVLSLLIAVAIGMVAAAVQISFQKGSVVLWSLGSTTWLFAGTLFPISALPPAARFVSKLLPLSHALTGMRLAWLQPLGSAALDNEIEVLLLFVTALLPASLAFLSWTVRRGRQLGTLSYY